MPKVAVSIVTWNNMQYLPDALASLAAQTFDDFSVIVVDNASMDGAAEFVRERYPEAVLIKNSKNLGFSRAHNQAIAYAAAHLRKDGDLLLLVMNPDIVLEPDYLEKIVDQMTRRPEAGSAGGKLYRMLRTGEDALASGEKTDIIDTTGIRMYRSRRIAERGVGERDNGTLYAKSEEVFGLSGALVMYRMQALESVAYKNEFFDEDFFAYKEDVDLAWRLRRAGWQALYFPSAIAYHYRGAGGDKSLGNLATLFNRFKKSKTVNFLSYRNHFLLLIKNERFLDGLLALPWILWYELRKFLVVLLMEQRSLRAIPSVLRLLPRMLKKRWATARIARVKGREIRKWFK